MADALLWGCVLVIVVVALGVVLLILRRRYHPLYGQGQDDGHGLSIERLEALRRAGQISEAEFRRLRRAALGLDSDPEGEDNPASSVAEEDDDG